jgi:hypothetical protein
MLATVQLPVHACDERFSGEPDVGKSACPVRRGESGPHFRVTLSPTLLVFAVQNIKNDQRHLFIEPDVIELVTTFFTGCSDLTRYLSAFHELTMSFFP